MEIREQSIVSIDKQIQSKFQPDSETWYWNVLGLGLRHWKEEKERKMDIERKVALMIFKWVGHEPAWKQQNDIEEKI